LAAGGAGLVVAAQANTGAQVSRSQVAELRWRICWVSIHWVGALGNIGNVRWRRRFEARSQESKQFFFAKKNQKTFAN
jgi:hypothetical protein